MKLALAKCSGGFKLVSPKPCLTDVGVCLVGFSCLSLSFFGEPVRCQCFLPIKIGSGKSCSK